MAELVLALDVGDRSEALRLLDRLPALRWVKVGPILMTGEGPGLVGELVERGLEVFLDLKWHDIPHTVAGAVAVAGGLGVRMATVHASGGAAMLRAAAGAAPPLLSVVGVTVLTSHPESQSPDYPADPGEWESGKAGGGGVGERVERLARAAMAAGLAGVVCSPLEVGRLRAGLGPEPLIVVPGIRRLQDDSGDQARVASPEAAVRNGATHLVVGRPILGADNPAAALQDFLAATS